MPIYVWPGISKYMESPGLVCWYPLIFLLPFSLIIVSALKTQLDLTVTVTTKRSLFQFQTSAHLHLVFHHGCLSKLLSLPLLDGWSSPTITKPFLTSIPHTDSPGTLQPDQGHWLASLLDGDNLRPACRYQPEMTMLLLMNVCCGDLMVMWWH